MIDTDLNILNAIILTSNDKNFYVPQYLLYRYQINFTGFKSDPCSDRIVGHWIAHPRYRNGPFYDFYSAHSCVMEYKGTDIRAIYENLDFGLLILLDMLRTSIRLAKKYKIKGALPMDMDLTINRRQLSKMRREHIKLGIWPNV